MSSQKAVSTLALLREHARLVLSGFFLIFFSVFGQTIFIGAYIGDIRETFGLSQSEISAMYMVGTVLSAVSLVFVGKLVDIMKETYVLYGALIFLAAGCLLMAWTPYALLIPVSFFLLRQCGQGLMPLISNTCINRYIENGRGRATAFAGLGASAHVAIFPAIALIMKDYFTWQQSWMIFAGFIIVALIPFFFIFFLTHDKRRAAHEAALSAREKAKEKHEHDIHLTPDKNQTDVLTDLRFYILVAVMVIVPLFFTAIMFFQEQIAISSNVSHEAFVAGFIFLTIASVFGNLSSGFIMDYLGEVLMLCVTPILFGLALVCFIQADNLIWVYTAFIFTGLSMGIAGTLGGPIVAKLFGTKYLGSVKSMLSAVMVLGTAASPLYAGVLMDHGYSMDFVLMTFLGYTVAAWLVLIAFLKMFR